MSEWHTRRGGAVLVDESGKIVGEVSFNIINGDCTNVATGERYVSMEHAKAAVEHSVGYQQREPQR